MLVSLLTFIMGAAFVCMFVIIVRTNILDKRRRTAIECIEALELLKGLLLSIQRHRGLTTAFLNGDHKVERSIEELRDGIEQIWTSLDQNRVTVEQAERFDGIHSHWQRVRERWQQQSVDNLIEQHNKLILNLIYLIESHAEDNVELVKVGRSEGIDVIWRELLETIEAIGQTRAIGVGIVAAGSSTAVDRIRLKFLINKADQHLEKLRNAVANSHMLGSRASFSAQHATEQVMKLRQFIDEQLMNDHPQALSAEQFFELATSSITPLEDLFSDSATILKAQFHNKRLEDAA